MKNISFKILSGIVSLTIGAFCMSSYSFAEENTLEENPCKLGLISSEKCVENYYLTPNEFLSTRASLPKSVDLSTSPCFPPIGNQGFLNACTSYAITYYQFSYEVNKLNNVTSTNNRCVYSPKWTYNLSNCCANEGSRIQPNYNVLKNLGCLKNTDFTYTGNASDYSEIPELMQDEKIEALKTRVSNVYQIEVPSNKSISSPNSSELNVVKNALNNGKILTVSSAFNWDSYFVNDESIAFRCKENSKGSHEFTIVGYDDNKSYDVNKNGVIESCEKGAFKVANSWGKYFDGYGIRSNTGFFWVMYDALNAVSANTYNAWESSYSGKRVPAFNFNEVLNDTSTTNKFRYITVKHYDLNYIAEVLTNLTNRFEFGLKINRSTSTSVNWSGTDYYSPFDGDYMYYGNGDKTFNGYLYLDYGSLSNPISNYVTGYKWFLYADCLITPNDFVKFRVVDKLRNPITSYSTISNKSEGYVYKNISLKKGDLNYSGTIESNDVTLLSNYLASYDVITLSNIQIYLADVNNDGVINSRDLAALNRLAS